MCKEKRRIHWEYMSLAYIEWICNLHYQRSASENWAAPVIYMLHASDRYVHISRIFNMGFVYLLSEYIVIKQHEAHVWIIRSMRPLHH